MMDNYVYFYALPLMGNWEALKYDLKHHTNHIQKRDADSYGMLMSGTAEDPRAVWFVLMDDALNAGELLTEKAKMDEIVPRHAGKTLSVTEAKDLASANSGLTFGASGNGRTKRPIWCFSGNEF
jgi:hypothetical protein